ncbi:MAG: glycerol kinase GlpK [Gammaproteobacteria bacterium]|nr:glycerol kinase GlpK [Gammaproteobacteria bacterium]MBU0850596.1 glycerol kinase GlpK [Gammaproteobacteria bacterium]MBU1268390.1 glycerol kinase GlpK [Gammaproteobacteria bacterium]MBU1530234.1 glycerol kinase GlpK [Gammaproteobacteria bacterium]MBU1780608.1 glycerol kinase GlpK [Gammaproteobacteria bacterium]
MGFILALDQGTTSSRAIVFNERAQVVASCQQEFEQIFPKAGWVEHRPADIWNTQLACARQAIEKAGIQPSDIAGIGITNQRETTVVWNRNTGAPVYNAIVWQDRRTALYCDKLRERGKAALIRRITGLELDSYFSATKVNWILDHVDGARAQAEAGELAFGTIDSWLIWNLTGGQVHATDTSNASRSMLLNIKTRQWDQELLALFDIPESMLPQVFESSGVFAQCEASVLGSPIPIAGVAGDQQAATFGQTAFQPGEAKNTYGTGCFMLLNTGGELVESRNRLLTTVGWTVNGKTSYMLEGSVFMAGAVVQWLRDGLGIIEKSADVQALAASVPNTDGVCLVPAFAGLGAPHWDPYARGTLVGMTRGTNRAHIARAALESIALQTVDLVQAMQRDGAKPLRELRVDGGASNNDLLMQIQADLLGVPVVRPTVTETTALGAAYLAGLAVGVFESEESLLANWQVDARFEPKMSIDERGALLDRWHRAVERSKGWADA